MKNFRELVHEYGLARDLINAVNALSTQQFFTVQGLSEMCELQSATIKALNLLIEELQKHNEADLDINRARMRIAWQAADDFHDVMREDASIKVDTGLDDLLSGALYSNDGAGLADSLGNIDNNIHLVTADINNDNDARLKVHVDGDVTNHPY